MAQDDRDDRTLLRPRPGGSRQGAGSRGGVEPEEVGGSRNWGQAVARAPSQWEDERAPRRGDDAGALSYSGVNPLVGAAAPLLSLVGQLRNTASHPDVNGLRRHVIDEVKRFETEARRRGIPSKQVISARYVLCSVIDETVMGTPWGSQSIWASHSLLSTFHNETWGGEKLFVVLDRILPDPAGYQYLIELIYICLSLGFKGKYMIADNGNEQVEELRNRVFDRIRVLRGDADFDLSPHWRPAHRTGARLSRYIPLWVVLAVAGALLVTIYAGFSVMLERSAEPVQAELEHLAERPASVLEETNDAQP